jgi:hypothetical protein
MPYNNKDSRGIIWRKSKKRRQETGSRREDEEQGRMEGSLEPWISWSLVPSSYGGRGDIYAPLSYYYDI